MLPGAWNDLLSPFLQIRSKTIKLPVDYILHIYIPCIESNVPKVLIQHDGAGQHFEGPLLFHCGRRLWNGVNWWYTLVCNGIPWYAMVWVGMFDVCNTVWTQFRGHSRAVQPGLLDERPKKINRHLQKLVWRQLVSRRWSGERSYHRDTRKGGLLHCWGVQISSYQSPDILNVSRHKGLSWSRGSILGLY